MSIPEWLAESEAFVGENHFYFYTNDGFEHIFVRIPVNKIQASHPRAMALVYSAMFSQHPLAPFLVDNINNNLVASRSILVGISRLADDENYNILSVIHAFLTNRNTPFSNMRMRVSDPVLHIETSEGIIRGTLPRTYRNIIERALYTGYSASVLNTQYRDDIRDTIISKYLSHGYFSEIDEKFAQANANFVRNLRTVYPGSVQVIDVVGDEFNNSYRFPRESFFYNLVPSQYVEVNGEIVLAPMIVSDNLASPAIRADLISVVPISEPSREFTELHGLLPDYVRNFIVVGDVRESDVRKAITHDNQIVDIDTYYEYLDAIANGEINTRISVAVSQPTRQQQSSQQQRQQPTQQSSQQLSQQLIQQIFQQIQRHTQFEPTPINASFNFENTNLLQTILDVTRNIEPTSRPNWKNVITFNDEKYNQLIKEYPGGGLQIRQGDILLLTHTDERTKRAIENIIKISERRPNMSALVIPSAIIQRPMNQLEELGEQERLSMDGAIVKNGNKYEYWYVDVEELKRIRSRYYEESISFTRPQYGNGVTFDFSNFENWEVINMGNKKIREFEHGYFIPVQQNKAIFVPSFAVPDMLVGVEHEVPITLSASELINRARRLFGIDLNYFPRVYQTELIKREPDASLSYGYEYITTALPLFHAIRFNYYLSETFKSINNEIPINPRGDSYGLHINMSIGKIANNRNALRFVAQYLRVMENLIKRITTPNQRYEYVISRINNWHKERSGLQHLRNDNILQQFWSQDVSEFKKFNGVKEYDLLREGRTLTERFPHSTIAEKISKYHTISFNKLFDDGIIEFRHPIYAPDGIYVANTIAMLSKFAGDMFIGAYYYPEYLTSDFIGKLIPNRNYTPEQLKEIGKNIFRINNKDDLDFLVTQYNKCKSLI